MAEEREAAEALERARGLRGELAAMLAASLSSESALRRQAEERIKSGEEQPLFALALACTATDLQQPAEAADQRLAAAILLKNVVERRWKRLAAAEQAAMRALLLNHVPCEGSRAVAAQLDLALALIARATWPQNWPQLFPALAAGIQRPDTRQRSLEATFAALDQLRTRSLPAQRRQLQQVCQQLMPAVHEVWAAEARTLLDALGPDLAEPQQQEAVLRAGMALLAAAQVLRALTVYGWPMETFGSEAYPMRYIEDLATGPVPLQVVRAAAVCAQWPWVRARGRPARHARLLALPVVLTQIARAMANTVSEALEFKSLALLPALPALLERAQGVAAAVINGRPGVAEQAPQQAFQEGEASEARREVEQVAVLHVRFLAQVLDCSDFKPPAGEGGGNGSDGNKLITAHGDVQVAAGAAAGAAAAAVDGFFSGERLQQLLEQQLLGGGMLLAPGELAEWQADPEGLAACEEEPQDALLVACADLLTTLVDRYPEPGCQSLLRQLAACEQQLSGPRGGSGRAVSLAAARMEAALHGVGLCGYYLYGKLDMGMLLRRTVLPVLDPAAAAAASDPGAMDAAVLRRRALWLLTCLAGEVPEDLQPSLLDYLLALVGEARADLLVRLTAAGTLRGLAAAPALATEPFLGRQDRMLRAILELGQTCGTTEARLALLEACRGVVDRVASNVALGALLEPLGALWQLESEPQWHLQAMGLVEAALEAAGEAVAPAAGALLAPLLARCMQAEAGGQGQGDLLLEPAVRIWALLARAAADAEALQPLLPLLPLLPTALRGRESALLDSGLAVLESHILLAAAQLVESHGAAVLRPLAETYVLTDRLRHAGECRLLRTLELLLRAAPQQALQLLAPLATRLAAACVRQPPPAEDAESGSLALHLAYLSLLARCVLEAGADALCATLGGVAALQALAEALARAYGRVGSSPLACLRRKLYVVALCRLLARPLARAWPLDAAMPVVLELWADAHAELGGEEQASRAVQQLVEARTRGLAPRAAARREALARGDALTQADLAAEMRAALAAAEQAAPPGALQALVQARPELEPLLRRARG